MTRMISNSDDVIDSRDVIARIDELETELQTAYESELEARRDDAQAEEGAATPPPTFDAWLTLTAGDLTAVEQDDARELITLRALCEEAEGYASDWRDGATLIRDSYFEDYARELAEDIGAIGKDLPWPACHIDWEAAADALKIDYTEVDFDGVSYWVR